MVTLMVWLFGAHKIYQPRSDGPSSLKDDIRQWEHKFSPLFLPLQSEARPTADSSQQHEDRFYHHRLPRRLDIYNIGIVGVRVEDGVVVGDRVDVGQVVVVVCLVHVVPTIKRAV